VVEKLAAPIMVWNSPRLTGVAGSAKGGRGDQDGQDVRVVPAWADLADGRTNQEAATPIGTGGKPGCKPLMTLMRKKKL
jgi:hypothetical protein